MNTDQNEIKSAVQILTFLNILDKTAHDLEYTTFFSKVWDVTNTIWKDRDGTNYTNHDLRHSFNIIKYFNDLDELYHWTNYEKLLFATASLIHDIGMQYNKWATTDLDKSGWPKPALDMSTIREMHNDLSFRLINEQLHKIYSSSYPENLCNYDRMGQSNALARSAMIAFAHSGDKAFPNFINDEATYHSREKYRLRLLAGTFRLCDEFDGDMNRITEPLRIDCWELNDYSKLHWFSCLFVEDTKLNIEGDVVYITINWQVPDECNPQQIESVRNMLSKLRESKIRNEINLVEDFYKKCGEHGLIKQFVIKPLSNNPSKFHLPLDEDKATILTNANSLSNSSLLSQTRLKGSILIDKLKDGDINLSPLPVKRNSATLEEALIEWFNQNKEVGHYELVTQNEHTDTYLNCRTLVSDQNLLHDIAHQIYLKHSKNNIDCVLAVGTSAIPLAVNVALRLKCAVTFTVSKERTNTGTLKLLKEDQKYIAIEISPILNKGKNILIIDDIISGGNVAKEILEYLFNTDFVEPPQNIYHFSIFKLGKREISKDTRIISYDYLVSFDDIIYEKAPCVYCKRGDHLIKEIEMY